MKALICRVFGHRRLPRPHARMLACQSAFVEHPECYARCWRCGAWINMLVPASQV